MNKNYKGKIEDAEFNNSLKNYLLKNSEGLNFEAIEASIEISDTYSSIEIDEVKEKQVIQKLRERTGIRGIGLAGKSLITIFLIGLNMF